MDKLYVLLGLGVIALILLPPSIKMIGIIVLLIAIILVSGSDSQEKAFEKAIKIINSLVEKHIPKNYQVVEIYPMFHTIILDIKPDGDKLTYRVILYRIGRRWGFVSTPMNIPRDLEVALINIVRDLK